MSEPAAVPMSLRDHLRVLQRRRWLLLAVLALCVGGAAAYAFLAPPSYEARAQVIVASQESRSTLLSAATPVLSMLGEPVSALGGSDLATQMQIVESRPTLESAWGLLSERPELLERLPREGLSDGLLEELASAVGGLGDQPPPSGWPEQWQAVLGTLMVAPAEDSDVIELSCRAPDPERARDFANALVLAYLGRSLADARVTASRARGYVDERLAEVEARLSDAEESLRQFGEQAGTVALDEAARQQVGLLVRLNEQAATADATLHAQGALGEELEGRLAETDAQVTAATVVRRNPEIAALQAELAQAEVERARLLEEYAPEAMPVRRAEAGLEELRGRLRATALEVVDSRQEALNPVAQQLTQEMIVAEAEELAARESRRVLEAAASRVEAQLADLPREQVALLKLQREIELLERSYVALKEKQQEYEIAERAEAPASRLLAHAIAPETPAHPRKLLTVAAGLLAGLLFGLLAVGLAEQLDGRIRDAERAASLIGLPVIGALSRGWSGGSEHAEAAETLDAILHHLGAIATAAAPAVLLASPDDAAEAEAVARALSARAAEAGRTIPVLALPGPVEPAESAGELALVVPPPGQGVLAAAPLLARGVRVVLIVNLRRARMDDVTALAALIREHGGEPVGLILTAAAGSSAHYIAAPART
jgi:succinoglycan biosynthesis transport protein ExoP